MDVSQQNILFGRALVLIKACSEDAVSVALAASAKTNKRIGEELLASGVVSRNDLIQAAIRQKQRVSIRTLSDLPDYSILLSDPSGGIGVARRDTRYALLGDTLNGRKRMFLVVSSEIGDDPVGQEAVLLGTQAGWAFAGRITASAELVGLVYAQAIARDAKIEVTDYSALQQDFDRIGKDAYLRGASDIHMSVWEGKAQIALRIHGELERYEDLTEDRARSLAATAYNTLSESGSTKDGFNPRVVQDAVIERIFPEGMIRFRYSCLPLAPVGFDVTLRIIPIGVKAPPKALGTLGYSADQVETLDRMFSNSSGLILFAGTTGSGKSTTMSHSLMKVAEDHPGKKIRTVEEPVEFKIEGAFQTPVTRIKGDSSDFVPVLRQLMRSDPDIIMVGEIRDIDTANLTIQAVRSGHLCVSTIHADGAPLCYDRLAGMGVSRTDLASVGLVAGLVYQKLVPLLCPSCKQPAEDFRATTDPRLHGVLERVKSVVGGLGGIYLRNPKGCQACNYRGIVGRTVTAEILRPTPAMLGSIAAQDSNGIWRKWRSTISDASPDVMRGRTAFEHAIWKMRKGLVSPVAVESEFRYLDEQPWQGVERIVGA